MNHEGTTPKLWLPYPQCTLTWFCQCRGEEGFPSYCRKKGKLFMHASLLNADLGRLVFFCVWVLCKALGPVIFKKWSLPFLTIPRIFPENFTIVALIVFFLYLQKVSFSPFGTLFNWKSIIKNEPKRACFSNFNSNNFSIGIAWILCH